MKNSLTLLLLLCSFICLIPEVNGADYYWVGGTGGNWNDKTKWASSSNGAGGAYENAPGPDDNVFFDNSSFSSSMQVVTISSDAACLNLSWNNISGSHMPTLFISANINLDVYGKLDLDGDMNVESDIDNPGTIRMLANLPGTTYGVSVNGNVLPINIEFAGVGGSWAITQDLEVTGDITITAGEIDAGANSQAGIRTITANQFIVNGSTVNLDLSRMDITVNSLFKITDLASLIHTVKIMSTDYFSAITTPGFEVSSSNAANFGSLNLTGANPVLNASGQSIEFHRDVTLEGTQSNTVLGSHSFVQSLILENAGAITKLEAGSTQTFDNAGDIVGTNASCSNYYFLKSTVDGNAAFLSKPTGGSISLERFYFQDIQAVQSNKFSVGLSVDLGNNVNLNFPGGAPASSDFYWIGDSGDWSDGSNWSLSSNGSAANCIPTANDNVFFDEHSFSSTNQTVTVDLPSIYVNSMTWTDPDTDVPTWAIPSGNIYIGGSLTLAPSMKLSIGAPASTTFRFTSAAMGNTVSTGITGTTGHDLVNVIFEGSGEWDLGSAMIISGNFTVQGGTFSTAGNRLDANKVSIDGMSVALTLDEELFTKTFEIKSIGSLTTTGSNIYTTVFDITPSGLSFNELILQDSDDMPAVTEGTLKGDQLNFVDVNLNNTGKSSVFGSHFYTGLLQLGRKGMIAEFEAGSVQTMNNLVSQGGDCGEGIFVRSTVSGSQVTFVSSSGPISVMGILLQDNIAQPAMTFSASGSQDLGNNVDWEFTGGAGTPGNFYWIGNDGDWNTGSNWSDASGGLPINCIPTPNDNVFFDANSFNGPNQEVTLDGPEQYCRSMTWNGVPNMPTMNLPAGNALRIYGSLNLLSSPTDLTLLFGDGDNATVNFRATSSGNVIRVSGHVLPNLTFDGPGGGWRINGAIEVGSAINLLNGHLNTDGNEAGSLVKADQFLVDGSSTSLSLGSSNLEIRLLFQIKNINTFDAGTSRIETNEMDITPAGLSLNIVQLKDVGDPAVFVPGVDPDLDTELNGTGLTFSQLILSGSNNNIVHGSHTFNQALELSYNNNPQLNLNFPIANFTFDGGSSQSFASNSTIFTSFFFPAESFPIPTRSTLGSSTGTDVTFSKSGNSVCLENILIANIAATGGASFGYKTPNAGISSSPGWSSTVDCTSFLPVDCIDFAAAVKSDNSVELYWITAQEINNSGFEVQRSTDGRRFETISWIEGAGTTSEAQKYTYIDLRTEGLTEAYYRIKQIDFDGTSAFACDIQAVNFRNIGDGPLQVFPNPANELIQVRWYGKKTGTTIIRLFDQSGRLIIDREWSTLEGNNQRELPVKDLPNGIYELQLVNGNGQMQATRLVKQ